jgi:hypothetical protein
MKKSDLKKHIKEEILSILKEASTALVTSKGGTKPVSFSSPTELNALKTDANVSSITTTAEQKIKETKKEIKVGDKVTYLGYPGVITAVNKEMTGATTYNVSYDKGNGKTKASNIYNKDGEIKPLTEDKFDDKITNLEKYTYTLNGKKVTPEIGYFDHSLKAMISTPRSGDEYFDYEFYRIGEPDESGNIELSPEKGKKGMYTEEMEKNSYEVVWTDRDYKQHSKVFKNDPQGSSENAKMKATKFLKSLEDKDKKSEYGLYRSINLKEAKIESDFFEREPKSKDIEKGEGIIAKTTRLLKFQKELKTLSKDMQDLAAEYREAEGSDKDEILRTLKVKTAAKKELEKKIEQLEKYV